MTLLHHTVSNLAAAARLGWLAWMHVLHAAIPCRWTAHRTWEDWWRRTTGGGSSVR